MIASVVVWLAAPVLPFLDIRNAQRVASIAGIAILAEVLFWIGALLAGPDAARRMKLWWKQALEMLRAKPKALPPESDASTTARSPSSPDAHVRTKPS